MYEEKNLQLKSCEESLVVEERQSFKELVAKDQKWFHLRTMPAKGEFV